MKQGDLQNITADIAIRDIAEKYTFPALVRQYSGLYWMWNNIVSFTENPIICFYDLLICTFLLFDF